MTQPAPELVWGLLARGIGLVYLISFASLSNQVIPTSGSGGYLPLTQRHAALRRDFPTWRRYFYFPTLAWLNQSDAMMRAMPWLGMLASAVAMVGGPHSPWAFVACYALYLSMDKIMALIFPWDCMLFEAGVFAIFLPALHTLPSLAAVSAPLPALAWVYRLLLFRVLFAFGRFKFLGSTRQDAGYLHGFFINQPLPSSLGWFLHQLPMWMLKLSLGIMFLVEIPTPFTVFFPGPWSIGGAIAINLLMVAIWVSGSFGYFSLIMMVVSLSWFDTDTARAFTVAQMVSSQQGVGTALVHAVIFLHFVGSLLSFPLNSYFTSTWLLWSMWTRIRPRFVTAPIVFYRLLHPFRWLHAYGVFPPQSTPAVKFVPVVEVSWDGTEWHTLEHHYSPTVERSRPRFCAPYHARLDQALIYETFAITDVTVMRNFIGLWEPYGHNYIGGALTIMRRALEGWLPAVVFDGKSIPSTTKGPPLVARTRTYMLEPTDVRELRSSGRWWKRTLIGPNQGPVTLDDGYWDQLIPTPELWHFEDVVWLGRSSLGWLMKRAGRGEDPHRLVNIGLLDGPEGSARAEVDRFWNEFLPIVAAHPRDEWTGLRRATADIRRTYSRAELYRFERLAGFYGALLFARLAPLFLDRGLLPALGFGKAGLDVKTYYHLGLLTRHIMVHGRDTYDAVFATPALAGPHARGMTLQSGNYLNALFHYESFVSQAQKLRLLTRYAQHEGRHPPTPAQERAGKQVKDVMFRIWGQLEMAEFLQTQFTGAEDIADVPEAWPRFRLNPRGELERIAAPDTGASL